MIKYRAGIRHNKETIKLMFSTERSTYRLGAVMIQFALGGVMIIAALTITLPIIVQVLLLGIGSWLIMSRDFATSMKAEEVFDARGGNLPEIFYQFDERSICVSGEGKSTFSYERVNKLIYSKDYLYIFFGKKSVFMIDKKTITPNKESDFLEFIAERTTCEWEANKNLLTLNFFDLIKLFK